MTDTTIKPLPEILRPLVRPRRLRTTPAMRRMVAETRVSPAQLMLPAFVAEGLTEPREISAMPGQYQHTLDSIKKLAEQAAEAGADADHQQGQQRRLRHVAQQRRALGRRMVGARQAVEDADLAEPGRRLQQGEQRLLARHVQIIDP